MGWSNSQFDGTLTIPTGATTGERIVIDGETGTITVYDASNRVVAEIDGSVGFLTQSAGGNTAQLSPTGAVRVGSSNWDNPASLSALPSLADFGFSTLLASATNDTAPGDARIGLILDPGTQSGTTPGTVQIRALDSSAKTNLVLGTTDVGRGLLDYTDIAANTATTTTTETIGITSDAVTFETGRAYEILIKGYVQSSVAGDQVQVRARKTDTAGQILIASMSGYTIPVANQNMPFYLGAIVRNATGPSLTDVVVVTFLRNSGTGNVRITADATHHAYVTIRDIGTAAMYPNAPELA